MSTPVPLPTSLLRGLCMRQIPLGTGVLTPVGTPVSVWIFAGCKELLSQLIGGALAHSSLCTLYV